MTFSRQVAQFIRDERLFTLQDRLLIGLSGGADSVALLRVLLELGYRPAAVHCNFRLRGDESERDEAFVRDLARRLGIEITVRRFDTTDEARRSGESIEMAARRLRYTTFEELRRSGGCSLIAVAHHRDDQIETIMLNLLRGTGVSGLRGMLPRAGNVVRPLLFAPREDIEHYLEQIRQNYVTDSTNLRPAGKRNQVRLELLPLMRRLNPSACDAIMRMARNLRETEEITDYYIARALDNLQRRGDCQVLPLTVVSRFPAPRALLHTWLAARGFNSAQIDDITLAVADRNTGSRFLSREWQLTLGTDSLWLSPLAEKDIETAVPLPVPGSLSAPLPGIALIELSVEPFTAPSQISRLPYEATLDADLAWGSLILRYTKPGDRFSPYGMKGSKLVSDYLTDIKAGGPLRSRQTVVCRGDEIVWLTGRRVDRRFAVVPGKTGNLLRIRVTVG